MKMKKVTCMFFCVVMFFAMLLPTTLSVSAASGPSLTTTLSDNSLQRGSKKTFDVWARNSAGDKIKATVKLNDKKVEPTWDDNEKTSYTLVFTKEGENVVTVSASSDGGKKKTLTYHINYKKAQAGESIGTAIWSIELFTIGCGYLIQPVEMPIYEGETAAEQLVRLLHSNGYVGYYDGTVEASFYLGYIADGTAQNAKYNNYKKSGTAQSPKKLNISPKIPSLLVPYLEDTMTFYDPQDYKKNWEGYLGEFAFTNGSGWMYSVNNIFPNVGFADSYLSDGDVVRVQYTLGYGADIGGFGAMGTEIPDVDNQPTSGYFTVANKDSLNKTICKALNSGHISKSNVKKAYQDALTVVSELNASQKKVDSAVKALNNALANPSDALDNSSSTNNNTKPSTQTGATTDTSKQETNQPSTNSSSIPNGDSNTETNLQNNQTSSETDGSVQNNQTSNITSSDLSNATQKDDNKNDNNQNTDNSSVWIIVIIAFLAVLVIAAAGIFFVKFKNKKKI